MCSWHQSCYQTLCVCQSAVWMITLLFLCHHSQIDEVSIIVQTGEQNFCSSVKKKKIQRLEFYLLEDLGAPESHLVLLHLEPPWLRRDLSVQVGPRGHASPVLPEDPAHPCLQPTEQVNNISRPVHPSGHNDFSMDSNFIESSLKCLSCHVNIIKLNYRVKSKLGS